MSLRPRAPAPCAAACCTSPPSFGADRLAAVLASGMRLGPTPPAPTGVVFTIEPDLKTCPICTEPMSGDVSKNKPFIVLECQHAFHVDCMSQWVVKTEGQPTCPVCRVAITQKDVDDIRENEIEYETYTQGLARNWTAYYRKGRLMRQEREGGSAIEYYDGEKGRERKVRLEFSDGKKWFYEGEKGAELLVRLELPDGKKHFFEGEEGAERLVRTEFPNGEKQFYEGEKGAERLVHVEFPNGKKQFFEGERGAERRVRADFPNGEKRFYEGEKDAERKVRADFPDGEKRFYEGERDAERLVRIEPESRLDDARTKRLRTRAIASIRFSQPSFPRKTPPLRPLL